MEEIAAFLNLTRKVHPFQKSLSIKIISINKYIIFLNTLNDTIQIKNFVTFFTIFINIFRNSSNIFQMKYCINLNWIFLLKHNFYDNSEKRLQWLKFWNVFVSCSKKGNTVKKAAKQQIGCAFMSLLRKDAN